MSLYKKAIKAYKTYRLLSGLKKQLTNQKGSLFLHDTHFSKAIPNKPNFLVYDCVDLPLMHQRTSRYRRNSPKFVRSITDYYANIAANKAHLITVTSPFYKPFLSHWLNKKTKAISLRNFSPKNLSELPPNVEVLTTLKSYPNVKRWLVIHNRIGNFLDIDGVLKALKNLPDFWGLCFIGVFDESLKEQIENTKKQYCLKHTVIFQPAIYGSKKMAALKCFDLGLVPLRNESQNLKRCLPNRCFDILASGLPQIAMRTRGLKHLSEEFPDRIFIPDKPDQKSFEALLLEVCEKIEDENLPKLNEKLFYWDDDFNLFFDVFNGEIKNRSLPKEVIIISENNPDKNNRLFNIQQSLIKKGYSVSVFQIDLENFKILKFE